MNLINKFDDYFSKIEESLNSPQKISWKELNNNLIGLFNIGNDQYRIECLKQIGNNYSYSFSYLKDNNWEYELTNIGTDGFIVFSTIIKGIEYLYNKYLPNSIIFSAIDKSDTRKRLYENYCNKFCEQYDYKLSNRGKDDLIIFILFKDDISEIEKEEIFDSTKKIIELGK